jgi:PIN like domain
VGPRRPLKLLLDECCGGRLAEELRALGVDVVEAGRDPALPPGTPDEDVLRWAGSNGCAFLTRDRHLRTRPAELAAIKAHAVAVFFVPPSPRTRDELCDAVTAALPRIGRCLERENRPFVRRILPNGALKDEKLG